MACIAMLGYGVVGSGVGQLILKNKEKFRKSLNQDLTICKILVRDINKYKESVSKELFTENIEDIFNEKVDIVVEAMGGLNPSYKYVKRALEAKKHVVTANKDLIAEHGHELLNIAEKNGVTLHFEASVGGGIPILKSLSECLIGNEINGIKAILNGTTNFILSKMNNDNMEYKEALQLAQKLGFAEANPESDVMGYDAARKLAILSTIAYDQRVNWKNINIQGITEIDGEDFKYAKMQDYSIKLVGISKREHDKIYASVKPVMVKKYSNLGKIENEYNAILVDGDAVGDVLFSGKGAGMFPTASAVFSDIIDAIGNKKENVLTFNDEEACVNRFWSNQGKWFLRFETKDRLGVMEDISKNFANCYILSNKCSISQNEVAAFVYDNDEKMLNNKIEKIKRDKSIISIKKILVLED